MSASEKWAQLVRRGCLCGSDRPADCTLHGPGDNRGIAAYFKAGMPRGFPVRDCTCAICGTGGCLLYPNIAIDDPERDGKFHPTLICPRCSSPAAERALVRDAETFGYALNAERVFAAPMEKAA